MPGSEPSWDDDDQDDTLVQLLKTNSEATLGDTMAGLFGLSVWIRRFALDWRQWFGSARETPEELLLSDGK